VGQINILPCLKQGEKLLGESKVYSFNKLVSGNIALRQGALVVIAQGAECRRIEGFNDNKFLNRISDCYNCWHPPV